MGGREFLTTATPDAMRNFARGYGDDNPLFISEDYGTTTRWGGQIAAPMIPIALNRPLYGDPHAERIKRPSFRGIHVFVSGSTWQWFRPLQEGDGLYSFGGTESVVEKKSEFAERSLLIDVHQREDEPAGRDRRHLAHAGDLHRAQDGTGEGQVRRPRAGDATATRTSHGSTPSTPAEEAAGATPRYWEDVDVGDELPPMAKGPLTTTDMIVFHAGGYGFVPYEPCANRIAYKNRQRIAPFYVKNEYGVPDVAQRVHWDNAWAQAIGNPMAYDYGVMRDCWLSHYMTDYIGDDGWLVSQSREIRKFNYIGDTHILTGEVVDKRRGGRAVRRRH